MPRGKAAAGVTSRRRTGHVRPGMVEDGEEQPVIRSDRVRRQIANDIITGVLRPGQELDEMKLAKTFNVSRTPVREALRQLAAAQPERGGVQDYAFENGRNVRGYGGAGRFLRKTCCEAHDPGRAGQSQGDSPPYATLH